MLLCPSRQWYIICNRNKSFVRFINFGAQTHFNRPPCPSRRCSVIGRTLRNDISNFKTDGGELASRSSEWHVWVNTDLCLPSVPALSLTSLRHLHSFNQTGVARRSKFAKSDLIYHLSRLQPDRGLSHWTRFDWIPFASAASWGPASLYVGPFDAVCNFLSPLPPGCSRPPRGPVSLIPTDHHLLSLTTAGRAHYGRGPAL